jgi:hypothetical protein
MANLPHDTPQEGKIFIKEKGALHDKQLCAVTSEIMVQLSSEIFYFFCFIQSLKGKSRG